MDCASCGKAVPEGKKFCIHCGAAVNAGMASPGASAPATPATPTPPLSVESVAPPAPAAVPPVTPAPTAVEAAPRKRHGCRNGCLVALGLLLLLAGLAAAVVFGLPQRLGLTKSRFDSTFAGGSDPASSQAVVDSFGASEQATAGISAFVLPVKDADTCVAYVVLDPSQGYAWNQQQDNPVKAALITVANSMAAKDASVTRVAVEFREEDGRTLYVMTATVEDIKAWGEGQLTDEQFFERAKARSDLQRVLQLQMDDLRELQEGGSSQ